MCVHEYHRHAHCFTVSCSIQPLWNVMTCITVKPQHHTIFTGIALGLQHKCVSEVSYSSNVAICQYC
jgi:hypothetical protein